MDRLQTQRAQKPTHDGYFTTSDGAVIHYLDFGEGRSIIFVPGWSQTAAMFKEQFIPLSKHFRCIAVDMRGHGDSADFDVGYTIDRLAMDLRELITEMSLDRPILLGHSMGASVLWRYVEKFGTANISRMVFVDQAPVLMNDEAWTDGERSQFGGIFDAKSLEDICSSLTSPVESSAVTNDLLRNMFTEQISTETIAWVSAENIKLERRAAASLLRDHCAQDWREVVKKIDVPCLVIGGKVSLMPWQSQQWLSQNIPSAKLVLFDQDEGGQHFMFLENPAKFNKIICNFCQ